MTARYAVYYVPSRDSALYALGAGLMGRCLYTGRELPRPNLPGFAPAEVADLTRDAARYGFHATIVAPFETEAPEDRLRETVARLAASTAPVVLPPLDLSVLPGGFPALIPAGQPPALMELEARAVRNISPLRKPLGPGDLLRRGNLPPRQAENLRRWGYHLVFEDFLWHLTLADALPTGDRGHYLLAALRWLATPFLGHPLILDRLALLRQPSREEPFVCQEVFPLH